MVKWMHWLIAAVDLILLIVYTIFSVLTAAPLSERINTYAFSLFPLAGAIILARQPRNRFSWVVITIGLAVMAADLFFLYGLYGTVTQPGSLPFADLAAVVSVSMWSVVLPSVVFMLLLFPNGKLPERRWKILTTASVLITVPVVLITFILGWSSRESLIYLDQGLAHPNAEIRFLFQLYDGWNVVMIACITLALIGFLRRFSRSRGVERQQLKWFAFVLTFIPVSLSLDVLLNLANNPSLTILADVLDLGSVISFPIVLLIAVTRYRLYDIDFIIRRTLSYSILTVILALIYFGSVVLTQRLFVQVTGETSAVGIVLSTLLIAALFQPLQSRTQALIDRRFYRKKYNAEHALERFSYLLRSEVDLSEIDRQLVTVVEENIQPEFAELWVVTRRA